MPGNCSPGLQRTGFDPVLHLLHELEVDGHAGGWIRSEEHTVTVLVNYYTITVREVQEFVKQRNWLG